MDQRVQDILTVVEMLKTAVADAKSRALADQARADAAEAKLAASGGDFEALANAVADLQQQVALLNAR